MIELEEERNLNSPTGGVQGRPFYIRGEEGEVHRRFSRVIDDASSPATHGAAGKVRLPAKANH